MREILKRYYDHRLLNCFLFKTLNQWFRRDGMT